MKCSTLSLAGIIITSSLLLSACTPPQPDTSDLNFRINSRTDSNNPPTQTSVPSTPTQPPKAPMKTLADFEVIAATQVTLTTTKGEITFSLFREEAPLTTANFLNLAKSGFYDGIVFHRVIPDFMAQVGDPLTKDASKQALWGTGGPGYSIPDEFHPDLKHDKPGIISMANSGPNTGGSQIFITYEATPWLDGKHAVFGQVTKGMDVLEQITMGDKIVAVTYQ